ncbi:hypothetical protein [Pelobacter propionicus]|uniref:hypothetical protein n=1 Tax=Pelobacter propionicus TaxID=29543 RepID=UPI000320C6C4|nr:hypothetical protein [Pelobacter propionicus]
MKKMPVGDSGVLFAFGLNRWWRWLGLIVSGECVGVRISQSGAFLSVCRVMATKIKGEAKDTGLDMTTPIIEEYNRG